jgi:hypothetical protein
MRRPLATAAAGVNAINLGYIWGKDMDPRTTLLTEAQLDEWVAQTGRRYRAATAAADPPRWLPLHSLWVPDSPGSIPDPVGLRSPNEPRSKERLP